MITEQLQKFGLSDKEAKTYEALASLGSAIVSEIATKAGINRSTAYVIVEALAKQGLVSVSEHGGIRKYAPGSPDSFSRIALDALKKDEELVQIGRVLATELKSVSGDQESKTDSKIYKGEKGLNIVYESIAQAKGLVRIFSGNLSDVNSLSAYLESFADKKRTASQIKWILPDTAETRKALVENVPQGEVYLIPSSNTHADFVVYEDTVAMISTKPLTATIMENQESATMFKSFYDNMSKQATRWNVKSESKQTNSTGANKKHPALVKAERRFWKI